MFHGFNRGPGYRSPTLIRKCSGAIPQLWKPWPVIVFLIGLALTYVVYQRVPKGFIPQEDSDYFTVAIQAPEGASLAYTVWHRRAGGSRVLQKQPEINSAFTVLGFSFGGSGIQSRNRFRWLL